MNANTNYNLTDHKILHNNYLDGLATELKVEIILHLSNPTSLAKCSREWNRIVNSPVTKSIAHTKTSLEQPYQQN